MTHKIRVACIGTSDDVIRAMDAMMKRHVIPPENVFLSRADGKAIQRFESSGCNLLSDDINAVMKGEIIFVTAPKRELASVLAPICGCTAGRYLIVLSDAGICLHEVAERVVKGTQIMVVSDTGIQQYTDEFPSYMKLPCQDMVYAILGERKTE